MKTVFSGVFTLEVDGRATLTFEASGARQAQQICKEAWLRDDLTLFRSNGVPLGTVSSKLAVRPATSEEIAVWPAPGSEDTELRCLMEQEAGHGEATVYAGVQG
jgi:hypothetical protein